MEKFTVGKLRDFVKELPLVFEWGWAEEMVDGHWLNHSALPEVKNMKFDDNTLYNIKLPARIAIDHHTRLKAANKERGIQGVIDYCNGAWARSLAQGNITEADLPGETTNDCTT